MANRGSESPSLAGLKALLRARGYSLIELLVVVGILGVLAAVAIPAFTGYLANARTQTAKAHLKEIADFTFICLAQNDYDGADCNELAEIGIAVPGGGWQIRLNPSAALKTDPLCWQVEDSDQKVRGCVVISKRGNPTAPQVGHIGIAGKCADLSPIQMPNACNGSVVRDQCDAGCVTGKNLGTCSASGVYTDATIPGGATCGTDVLLKPFADLPKCRANGACS